jgi:hypothetical protein
MKIKRVKKEPYMKLTDKEKEICEIYSQKDDNGFVDCERCPLNLDRYLDAPQCYLTIDKEQKDFIKKVYGVNLTRFGKDRKVAYIAGAISSKLDTYQYDFSDAETVISWYGFKVLSPAWLPVGLHDYSDYMKISKEMLMASDIVFFLDGWEESNGARQEYEWAKKFGKQIAYYGKDKMLL